MRNWHFVASAALAATVMSGVTGCRRAPQPDNTQTNVTNGSAPKLPSLPAVERPLDRAALLQRVLQAATAAALGRDDRETQLELDGDRFELRIRFGCPGSTAAESSGPFEVSYDSTKRTLRLSAAPDVTTADRSIAALASEAVEAVEGFWIPRPWLLAAGCPVAPQPVEGSAEDEGSPRTEQSLVVANQRLALAQFFTESDPRTRRRDKRAYEVTKILPDSEQPSDQGYDLVLSGRLRKLPDGRVIACTIEEADQPPVCVVSAEFDRVWVERPDTGTMLAEWGDA